MQKQQLTTRKQQQQNKTKQKQNKNGLCTLAVSDPGRINLLANNFFFSILFKYLLFVFIFEQVDV